MDPRIEEYIRTNRRKYTREAITKQLEEAGHDRAAIDATWAALEARDPDETVGEAFWSRFLLFLLVSNVAALLLVGLLSGMFIGSSGAIIVVVILGIALTIGALISWGLVALLRPTQLSRGTAMAIGGLVPLLFTFLIAGSCYALVGGLGGLGTPTIQGTMTVEIGPPLAFEATGTAGCNPTGGGNYSVFSSELGLIEGRSVSVSIDSYNFSEVDGPGVAPPRGGGEVETVLNISLVPSGEDRSIDYYSVPETTIDVQTGPDGLSGSLTFQNLVLIAELPDADADAISGTITWTCE